MYKMIKHQFTFLEDSFSTIDGKWNKKIAGSVFLK